MAPRAAQQRSSSDMTAFRGRARQGDEADQQIADPVEDNPNPRADSVRAPERGAAEDGDGGDQQTQQQQKPAEPEKPQSDQARDRIFAKFGRKRAREAGEDAPEPDDETADETRTEQRQQRQGQDDQADQGDGAADQQRAAADETADDAGADDGTIELAVDGKKLKKSIEEISVLADMSIDEVKANPARAAKYARREIASLNRLEKSKQILRDTTSRDSRNRSQDAGDDPARTEAQSQGGNAGSQDDASDRGADHRNPTGTVDFKKLAEDIQIESPEKVAAALENAFKLVAQSTSREVFNQSQQQDAVSADRATSGKAMKSFIDAHPELKGKQYIAPAIAAGLIDEYRDDLREALIAEGDIDEDEIDAMLTKATTQDIAVAHRARRLARDPNVRAIDKTFIERAYKRVQTEMGGSQQQQRQDFQQTRQSRKENLRTQPRRSSVPPANQAQQQQGDSTSLRKQAVARMQKDRGQKQR